MRSNECWVEGGNHFPWPTSCAPVPTAQHAVGLLCCQDRLRAHIQLTTCPFYRATPQSVSPSLCSCKEHFLPRGRIFAFLLDEFHEVPVSPFLHPAKVLVGGSQALECIYSFPQFGVICKLVRYALFMSSRSLIKILNRTGLVAVHLLLTSR